MMLFLALVLTAVTAMPAPRKGEDYFVLLDADGDGVVEFSEFAAQMTLERVFRAIDFNCDGIILRGDILLFSRDLLAGYDRLDLNHDDQLTLPEVEQATTLDRFFTFFDSNGDGLVERAEAEPLILLVTAAQNAAQGPCNDIITG